MEYFDRLERELNKCYSLCTNARKKGYDPKEEIEIKITTDVASRVEGIVGPPGIQKVIREMEKEGMNRETIAFEIARKLAAGEIIKADVKTRIEQAIRTSVGILTEGVLVAPTEGIAKVAIKENHDGTNYLSVYYSGPIRSAGGTAAALSVVIADIARRAAGIGDYRPTQDEIERYVEEVNLYEARVTHLQYKPSDEHVRIIVKNCPVCIDGEPTEEMEVSVHKNLERVDTNRIRGGVPLVVCEGIALKSSKVIKYVKKLKLGWESWLEKIIKVKVKKDKVEIKPDYSYLEGLVAGRPVFSYPSLKGGFRLRYAKTRTNGIMAKSIHPALMPLFDNFLAFGTQMKIERPGKGCVVTTCSDIEPPVVRLKNGDIVRVHTLDESKKINPSVDEILFLGDIAIAHGDFLKSNHPLLNPGYCEEWWDLDCESLGVNPIKIGTSRQAFEFSKNNKVPLHPKYTLFWDSINLEELKILVEFLKKGKLEFENDTITQLILPLESDGKRILEKILALHLIRDEKIIIESNNAYSILLALSVLNGKIMNFEKIEELISKENEIFEILNKASGIKIMPRGGTYIGARMGRPEKSKERAMDGKPNGLFPTGSMRNRSLVKKYKELKELDEEKRVNVELVRYRCTKCSNLSVYSKCDMCQAKAIIQNVCVKCGTSTDSDMHCEKKTICFERRPVDLIRLFEEAKSKLGGLPEDVKGVKGLGSKYKIPERLEKVILRARHGVYVFRDGTSRVDSTDVPLTHFKPEEIGISVQKLKELGYSTDYLGKELTNSNQIVPLKVQDVLLSRNSAEYLLRVSKFIDDLLVNLYGMPAFYNATKVEDLIGHLTVGLSPHTSAGVLSRVIGFTRANIGYAHPYFHTAKRRNCDADEDSLMLLIDALLNFSKEFLSERRGGTMDAPIVLNVKLNPKEVDDEVFCMEIVDRYPLEFYHAAQKNAAPYEVKVKKIEDILGKPEQYGNLPFTINSENIDEGNIRTTYIDFESIPEKIDAQFNLEKKIRSVDERDVAKRLIMSHFIPDLYGNLRSYSRQTFRCVSCNTIHRRPPLNGKCKKCRGKLTLTIHKGGIAKYLEISKGLCEKYDLDDYLKQRLGLVKREIKSIFEDERIKQLGLSDFI